MTDLWEEAWAAEKEKLNSKPLIRHPFDVVPVLGKTMPKASQEQFCVVTLDGAHRVIKRHIVTKGLVNRTVVHPREVFRPAIKDNATAIICAHNHPSGALDPSDDDNAITKRLREAGQTLGIPMLDHIIVSRTGYYSYLEKDRRHDPDIHHT